MHCTLFVEVDDTLYDVTFDGFIYDPYILKNGSPSADITRSTMYGTYSTILNGKYTKLDNARVEFGVVPVKIELSKWVDKIKANISELLTQ